MADPTSGKRRSEWILAISCLLAALAAVATIPWTIRAAPPPLRIGINSWPGYEFLHLAKAKGLYEQEGVEVEIVEFSSLLDARRAFERGQIDGLGTTAVDVVLSLGQTLSSPRIVQVIDYSEGGDKLLVDNSIAGIGDLRGKRVGLEAGTVGTYVLARALSSQAMSLSDIVPVPSDQISMLAAFRKGQLDAVVTYPPFSQKHLSGGEAKEAFSSSAIPHEIVDVIAFDRAIVDERPEQVRAVLRAFWKARDLARTDSGASIAAMARREGVSDSEFAAALNDGIHLVELADQPAYLAKGGRLERVVEFADSILRLEGSIQGELRIDSAVDPRFAAPLGNGASE